MRAHGTVIERPGSCKFEHRCHNKRKSRLVKCAHRAPPGSSSVAAIINAATQSRCIPPYGPITYGCPTWETVSTALSAVTAAPMSGRYSNMRTRGKVDQFGSPIVLSGNEDWI